MGSGRPGQGPHGPDWGSDVFARDEIDLPVGYRLRPTWKVALGASSWM